jgi:hypothetical protein
MVLAVGIRELRLQKELVTPDDAIGDREWPELPQAVAPAAYLRQIDHPREKEECNPRPPKLVSR